MGWTPINDDEVSGDEVWDAFGEALQKIEDAYMKSLSRKPTLGELDFGYHFVRMSRVEKKEPITRTAVAWLNKLLELDKHAIGEIFEFRVSTVKELAEHPGTYTRSQDGNYSLGVLGLLNGIFNGQVLCLMNEDGEIEKFLHEDDLK